METKFFKEINLKYFNIKGIKIWAHIYCIAWIDIFSFKDG